MIISLPSVLSSIPTKLYAEETPELIFANDVSLFNKILVSSRFPGLILPVPAIFSFTFGHGQQFPWLPWLPWLPAPP